MSEVIEFFCQSQIDFANLCVACGCPDWLHMNTALLVYKLGAAECGF